MVRLKISLPKKSVLREEGKLGSNHTVKVSKGTWHHVFRSERVYRKELLKSVNLKCAVCVRQILGSSGASSSSTSYPQDSPSTSSSPASLRSDAEVSGSRGDPSKTQKNQNQNKDNQEAAGNRLARSPGEVVEDTEVPASANISHDSGSEHPAKVASRKHSIHTHIS